MTQQWHVASVSSPSGADVWGGDASAQRDDSGQVGFLRHRTVLEPPATARKTESQTWIITGPG